jgi:hypothetical protein
MTVSIRFTPRQAEMLADRLALPDCVADALVGWEPARYADRAEIETRCRRLESTTLSGRIDVSRLDDLDRLILADAHDGSTWFAMREAEAESQLEIENAKATVRAVQRKLDAAGISVDEPVLW